MQSQVLFAAILLVIVGNIQARPNGDAVDNACEHSVDIGGANEDLAYAGVKSTGKECQVTCQGDTNCDFFVWIGQKYSSRCYLRQFEGQRFNEITRSTLNGAFAGLADCLEKDNQCLLIDIDYFGNDLNGCGDDTDTAQLCQELCRDTIDCVQFTWLNNNFQKGARYKECCMKSSINTNPNLGVGAISGPKQCDLIVTTSCSGTLDTLAKQITSPNYPSNYPNRADCNWLIVGPHASRLSLVFKQFKTETDWDRLSIYDGPSSTFPLIGSFGGFSVPSNISSTGESVYLEFNSDAGITFKGFEMEYHSVYKVCTDEGGAAPTFTKPLNQNCEEADGFWCALPWFLSKCRKSCGACIAG